MGDMPIGSPHYKINLADNIYCTLCDDVYVYRRDLLGHLYYEHGEEGRKEYKRLTTYVDGEVE